jgi:hypothetical protein
MYEDIILFGTFQEKLQQSEGVFPGYRGSVTYDPCHKKYYVLVIGSQNRYIAVINDLHRFNENFAELDKKK